MSFFLEMELRENTFIHFFILERSLRVQLVQGQLICLLELAMSDPTPQNVIEIDSEKEENNSKKTESVSSRPLPPSLMNLKFNESMFPKLASLLKRGPNTHPKEKQIEVIEVNSPPNPTTAPPVNSITPIKQDRLQKQASQLTRIGSALPTITVEEDLIGIPLLQRLPSYLAKTRKYDFIEQKQVSNPVNVQPEKISLQKVKGNEVIETMVAQPNMPKDNLPSEAFDEARETAIYRQIVQLTGKIAPKTLEPEQREPPVQIIHDCIQQAQIRPPQEPESMQVERPCSEAQSSVFASQLLAVQSLISNKAGSDVPIENENPQGEQIIPIGQSDIANEAIPLPYEAPPNEAIALPSSQNIEENKAGSNTVERVSQSLQEPIVCEKPQQPIEIIDDKENIASMQRETMPANLMEAAVSRRASQRTNLTQQQVQLFKLKISHFIPDLQGYVKDAKSEEMFEIYKMIKKDMQIDLLQIELPPKLPEGISKQPSQITPAQTADIIPIRQQPIQQPIPQPPTSQSMQKKQDHSQPDHSLENDTVAQFQLLKDASEGQLRRKLIEYFPDAKDVLQEMSVTELKRMVEETLDEMNRNKKTPVQRQRQPQGQKAAQQVVDVSKGKAEQMVAEVSELSSKPIVTLEAPVAEEHKQTEGLQINKADLPQDEVDSPPALQRIEQPAVISSGQPHKETNEDKQDIKESNAENPSKIVAEMRVALQKKLPDLSNEIGKLKDSNIKMIATNNAREICIDLDEPEPVPKEVESLPLQPPEQPTIDFIVNQCIKMFPDVAKDIKNLKEQQIRSIYQEMIIKAGINLSTNKNQSKDGQLENDKKTLKASEGSDKGSAKDSGKKVQETKSSAQKSLKRTYEEMIATNPKKEEEKAGDKKDIKKKFSIAEIRKILITKLPQLKSNIMMLDDSQIQAIFYEGIGSGKAPSMTQSNPSRQSDTKAPQPPKNVLLQAQKKSTSEPAGISLPVSIPKASSNVQVFQTFDDRRQKKLRTVVLVQSELECAQKEGEAVSKMLLTENGVVKKCNCDCCKKLDVAELLRRLGQLLDSPQK